MTETPDKPAAPAPPPAPARPPLIAAPIYISGRELPPEIRAAAAKAAPGALGVVGVAILSAVAGYFVPKLLDRFAVPMPDPDHGDDVELEVGGDAP